MADDLIAQLAASRSAEAGLKQALQQALHHSREWQDRHDLQLGQVQADLATAQQHAHTLECQLEHMLKEGSEASRSEQQHAAEARALKEKLQQAQVVHQARVDRLEAQLKELSEQHPGATLIKTVLVERAELEAQLRQRDEALEAASEGMRELERDVHLMQQEYVCQGQQHIRQLEADRDCSAADAAAKLAQANAEIETLKEQLTDALDGKWPALMKVERQDREEMYQQQAVQLAARREQETARMEIAAEIAHVAKERETLQKERTELARQKELDLVHKRNKETAQAGDTQQVVGATRERQAESQLRQRFRELQVASKGLDALAAPVDKLTHKLQVAAGGSDFEGLCAQLSKEYHTGRSKLTRDSNSGLVVFKEDSHRRTAECSQVQQMAHTICEGELLVVNVRLKANELEGAVNHVLSVLEVRPEGELDLPPPYEHRIPIGQLVDSSKEVAHSECNALSKRVHELQKDLNHQNKAAAALTLSMQTEAQQKALLQQQLSDALIRVGELEAACSERHSDEPTTTEPISAVFQQQILELQLKLQACDRKQHEADAEAAEMARQHTAQIAQLQSQLDSKAQKAANEEIHEVAKEHQLQRIVSELQHELATAQKVQTGLKSELQLALQQSVHWEVVASSRDGSRVAELESDLLAARQHATQLEAEQSSQKVRFEALEEVLQQKQEGVDAFEAKLFARLQDERIAVEAMQQRLDAIKEEKQQAAACALAERRAVLREKYEFKEKVLITEEALDAAKARIGQLENSALAIEHTHTKSRREDQLRFQQLEDQLLQTTLELTKATEESQRAVTRISEACHIEKSELAEQLHSVQAQLEAREQALAAQTNASESVQPCSPVSVLDQTETIDQLQKEVAELKGGAKIAQRVQDGLKYELQMALRQTAVLDSELQSAKTTHSGQIAEMRESQEHVQRQLDQTRAHLDQSKQIEATTTAESKAMTTAHAKAISAMKTKQESDSAEAQTQLSQLKAAMGQVQSESAKYAAWAVEQIATRDAALEHELTKLEGLEDELARTQGSCAARIGDKDGQIYELEMEVQRMVSERKSAAADALKAQELAASELTELHRRLEEQTEATVRDHGRIKQLEEQMALSTAAKVEDAHAIEAAERDRDLAVDKASVLKHSHKHAREEFQDLLHSKLAEIEVANRAAGDGAAQMQRLEEQYSTQLAAEERKAQQFKQCALDLTQQVAQAHQVHTELRQQMELARQELAEEQACRNQLQQQCVDLRAAAEQAAERERADAAVVEKMQLVWTKVEDGLKQRFEQSRPNQLQQGENGISGWNLDQEVDSLKQLLLQHSTAPSHHQKHHLELTRELARLLLSQESECLSLKSALAAVDVSRNEGSRSLAF